MVHSIRDQVLVHCQSDRGMILFNCVFLHQGELINLSNADSFRHPTVIDTFTGKS